MRILTGQIKFGPVTLEGTVDGTSMIRVIWEYPCLDDDDKPDTGRNYLEISENYARAYGNLGVRKRVDVILREMTMINLAPISSAKVREAVSAFCSSVDFVSFVSAERTNAVPGTVQ